MKKIVLYTQKGVDDSLIAAAHEAIDEFISMFPEYKNSFTIELRKDENIHDFRHSLENKIVSSRDSSRPGEINAANLTDLLGQDVCNNGRSDEIPVCLVDDKIFDKNNINGQAVFSDCFGLTTKKLNYDALVVSAEVCGFDKELIKTIFIHELGHVFNATHQNRANTVYDETKGTHCKNDLCIMGDNKYPELNQERLRRKAQGNPPFCDECIASMREYMSRMPELVRRVQTQQIQTPQQQPGGRPIIMPTGLPTAPLPPTEQWTEVLPVLPHNNREWKKEIREFYKNVAARDGDTYKENIRSQNYVARIKRADGSTLEIQANNEFNIALGATKTPQRDNLPSLKDMRDLVKLTQQKKSGMNFGENNEPEFNGRLLIACLEAQPKPLAMRNRPQITPEFLAQLQPETKRRLQAIINGRQQQQQRPQQNTR